MRLFLFMLLLAFASFAEDFCSGKTDEFDVQVLDNKLRPIENAEVTITYDTGTSFGEKYFTTKPRETDKNGLVHFKISNQGTDVRKIDCKIIIRARLNEILEEVEVEATKHGSIISIKLEDVFPIDFYVKDQFVKGIENASVTIGTKLQKTNERGFTRFFLPEGEYDYLASFDRAKQSGKIFVEDDMDFTVTFPYDKVTIEVIDDLEQPIQAKLTIFDNEIEIRGKYTSEIIYGQVIPYEINYLGETRNGEIYVQENSSALIIYDIHPPTFQGIVPETINNRTKLTITVTDPGKYGSGVDIQSLKVSYKVEPSDATAPFSPATVYTVGFNTFSAEFPELPQNSIVSFRADVKDKIGNRATVDGKFSTLVQSNTTEQNQTVTQENTNKDQELPLIYIVGGVFVAVLAIYLVFRIKNKG